MLPFPEKFDLNEWFVLLNIVIGFATVAILPKRYPLFVAVLLMLFSTSLAVIVDHSIANPPLDMYDINDKKKYEITDLMTYLMYAPWGLVNAYLYDKWKPKGFLLTAYVALWSAASFGYEWLAVKIHVFTYNEWRLIYSLPVYLFCTTAYLMFFRFLRKSAWTSIRTS